MTAQMGVHFPSKTRCLVCTLAYDYKSDTWTSIEICLTEDVTRSGQKGINCQRSTTFVCLQICRTSSTPNSRRRTENLKII